MGLQGCHGSHLLPLYPLDFRTDPRAGTNPRPAWLPGAERRCSASGALWESEAWGGGGDGVLWGTHNPEIPSNISQFLSVVYFCPLCGSLLAIFNVWIYSINAYFQKVGGIAQSGELLSTYKAFSSIPNTAQNQTQRHVICSPSTWKVETRRLEIQVHLWLRIKSDHSLDHM